jgi:DNA polymerase-3 subunit gamma/tau
MERLASGEAVPARAAGNGAPAPPPEQKVMLSAPASFEAFADLIESEGKRILAHELRENYRLVEYGPPMLMLQQRSNVRNVRDVDAFLKTLRDMTDSLFGQKWQVGISDGPAEPTLREREQAAEAELKQKVLDSPIVKAAFEAFPDAELAAYNVDERRSG